MRKNRFIWGIAISIVATVLILGGFGIASATKALVAFGADGYVLEPSEEVTLTTNVNTQHYFSEGTQYRDRYGKVIEFKDQQGSKVGIAPDNFVHYETGALSAFRKGVIMDLDDLEAEQLVYYGVSTRTTIMRNGNTYSMMLLGNPIELDEFAWKISDSSYLIASPEITLYLSDSVQATFEDYVQLKYIDGGIVRIIHQQGTYQTVSAEAYLVTADGVELRLNEQKFYVNGEPAVSLDSMVIGANDNVELDATALDTVGNNVPTFNVINGKDGEDGEEGEEGEEGDIGEDGEDGTEGDEGGEGEEGQQGAQGKIGTDGTDGSEGDGGAMGYDGIDGEEGEDGQREDGGGVVAVQQKVPPTVALKTDTYEVGPGGFHMELEITDEEQMLTSDLTWVVYDRATMEIVTQGTYPQGMTGGVISPNGLNPGAEYVVIVSGEYSIDGSGQASTIVSRDFFTKIITTDDVGVKLSRVKVTDKTITVNVDADDTIGTYDVAILSGLTEEAATFMGSFNQVVVDGVISYEYTFETGDPVGATVEPNKDYIIRIQNLVAKSGEMLPVNAQLAITTLKETPHYLVGVPGSETKVPIADPSKLPTAVPNDRYSTLTVSIEEPVDPQAGIIGYRYEIYSLSTMDPNDASAQPDQVITTTRAEAQVFSVDSNLNYIARVVVLFDDNEKEVELPTLNSAIASFVDTEYPVGELQNIVVEYDAISATIKIVDPSYMLHVSADYPLIVTLYNEAGDALVERLITYDDIDADTSNTQYFNFSIDGLRSDTVYNISVRGPVWNNGNPPANKEDYADYYIIGQRNVTTLPTPLRAIYLNSPSGSDLFSYAFGVDAADPAEDAEYEANNMEKVVFELFSAIVDEETGKYIPVSKLGETALVDMDLAPADTKHRSSFGINYGAHDPAQVLTPASFGMANNDSRLSGGGHFIISVKQATDYTEDMTELAYTNEIFFDENQKSVGFELTRRHVKATNPNAQVDIELILNKDVKNSADPDVSKYYDATLADDTVIGFTAHSLYAWADITQLTYNIHEIKSDVDINTLNGNITLDGSGDPRDPVAANPNIEKQIATETITRERARAEALESPVEPMTFYLADYVTEGLQRGKRYIVSYIVVGCKEAIDCSVPAEDDVYPFCVEGAPVPLYRSAVFGLPRQIPVVKRYPYSSTGTGTSLAKDTGRMANWKYTIVDPDRALDAAYDETDKLGKIILHKTPDYATVSAVPANTATLVISGTPGAVPADSLVISQDIYDEYVDVVFTGLGTPFYKTQISYRLFDGDAPVITHSQPLAISDVDNGPRDVKIEGLTPEVAAMDLSGYLLKLSLVGNDIYDLVAVKVTIAEKANPANKVIYDPVPIRIRSGYYSGGGSQQRYGDVHLEYEPLRAAGLALTSKQVTVSVEGYYNTYNVGLKDFVYSTDDFNAIKEVTGAAGAAFALRAVGVGGSAYNYQYLDSSNTFVNTGVVNSTQTMLNSLIVADAPTFDFDNPDGTIALRAAKTVLNSDTIDINNVILNNSLEVTYDETGMRSQSGDVYYMPERLELEAMPFVTPAEADIQIDYLLPGIARAGQSIGMASAVIDFNLRGVTPNDGIYIELWKTDGNVRVPIVQKEQQITDGTTEYYYEVDPTGSGTVGKIAPGPEALEIILRGLEKDTNYYIKAYCVEDGVPVVYLYDYANEQIGWRYEFKTQTEVEMELFNPTWLYNTYQDKHGEFGFRVKGSEGTGFLVYYQLCDSAGNPVADPANDANGGKGQLLPQLGQYVKYYDSDPGLNNKLIVPVPPGSGRMGGNGYQLVAKAYDDGGDVVGTAVLPFTTPPLPLANPIITAITIPGSDFLQFKITLTNIQHSVADGAVRIVVSTQNGDEVAAETLSLQDTASDYYDVTIGNLSNGMEYVVTIYVNTDPMNTGSVTNKVEYVFRAITTSSAAGRFGYSYSTENYLIMHLSDLSNFDDVARITYTITNAQGTMLASGGNDIAEWANNGGVLTFNTGHAITASGTYRVSLQFYDASNNLLGSSMANTVYK